jgi:hypothetical protein
MPHDKFRKMIDLVVHVICEWGVAAVGHSPVTGDDLVARIKANPEAYHLKDMGFDYAYRIGGQLGERLISAWIDWQFPKAIQYNIKTVSEK